MVSRSVRSPLLGILAGAALAAGCSEPPSPPVCGNGVLEGNEECDAAVANGSCDDCRVACNTGFANCNGAPADGCEADLTAPATCAACGTHCASGELCFGACVTVVASSQPSPVRLAADATHLYWTVAGTSDTDGAVLRASLGGGEPEVVAANGKTPTELALDASNVFWIESRRVLVKPKGAGDPIPLTQTQPPLRGLAIEATDVYFATSLDLRSSTMEAIWRVPAGGSEPPTLFAERDLFYPSIAISSDFVYWTGESSLMRKARNGQTQPEAVTGTSNPDVLRRGGDDLFWVEGQTLRRFSSGTVADVASATGVVALAVDATHVYWIESPPLALFGPIGQWALRRSPKGSGVASDVTRWNERVGFAAVDLALTGEYVYVAWRGSSGSTDGLIFRIPKYRIRKP